MTSTRESMIIATIRTAVPGMIGYLIARAVAKIPAIGDVIAWIDEQISQAGYPGVTVLILLQLAAVGLAIAAYYWLARKLGARWPSLERWLLGSSKTPVYPVDVSKLLRADLKKD